MLDMRLNLLDSLLDTKPEITGQEDVWSFKPGTLTIVDLSLSIRQRGGRVCFIRCLSQLVHGWKGQGRPSGGS